MVVNFELFLVSIFLYTVQSRLLNAYKLHAFNCQSPEVGLKDRTPKEQQSSVVLSSLGLDAKLPGYILAKLTAAHYAYEGKCLQEIVQNLTTISILVNMYFQYFLTLLNLPSNLFNLNELTILSQIILNNCLIIDTTFQRSSTGPEKLPKGTCYFQVISMYGIIMQLFPLY